MKAIIFTVLLLCALAASALAAGHSSHGDMREKHVSPASEAYSRAMDSMHDAMMEGIMDPDPDRAFVRGMLPHHVGAVEMARIQLKYGKDPELLNLAREIIEAQEKEIAQMQEWIREQKFERHVR